MEKICKNCKYYTPQDTREDGIMPYGQCEKIEEQDRDISKIGSTTSENWDKDLPSFVHLNADYSGSFIQVRNDFGCIKFEQI